MRTPKYRGGHRASTDMRQIVANPNGNREERRAAKRLAARKKRDEKNP